MARHRAKSSAKVETAGGVLWREHGLEIEVALIHRPGRDDWTLPKGRRERSDDSLVDCARREVEEETGFGVKVGERAGRTVFPGSDPAGPPRKIESYWLMRPRSGTFVPNSEVDGLCWVGPETAAAMLSYDRDWEIVKAAIKKLHKRGRHRQGKNKKNKKHKKKASKKHMARR